MRENDTSYSNHIIGNDCCQDFLNSLHPYGYLDISPISKKEIRVVSKDKKIQGIYDFEILFQPHSRLVRMRGTIVKVLRYARQYTIRTTRNKS